jgi:transcriptional regulator with XRE-family HTH domain
MQVDTGVIGSEGVSVGTLLRDWRSRRRLSQMELALDVGISPRHLSFVETGRSRPSADLLMTLAARLEVPLRERNRMLLSSGYAPRYSQQPLQARDMQPVRAALQRLLELHQPYPGLVLDRQWNVVLANDAALSLTALLPPALREPSLNIFRASLHPQGLSRLTANFEEWAGYLLHTLQAAVSNSSDAELASLEQEVLSYPNVQALRTKRQAPLPGPALLVPCVLDLPGGRLSMFTTLTTFGTPRDVTLEELCVELFYPADAETLNLMRAGSTPVG